MEELDQLAERFEMHRPHLRGVAYRMLGSLSEAEDAVQETWLRLSRADVSGVENLGGWLTTVTGRVSSAEIPGATAQSPVDDSTDEPRLVRAVAISSVSRDRSARRTMPGPSASAASTSSRLVSDFEPGSETRAETGVRARGAGQSSTVGRRVTVAGYRPTARSARAAA